MFDSALRFQITLKTIALNLEEINKSEKKYILSKISDRDYLLTCNYKASIPSKFLAIEGVNNYANENYLLLEIIKDSKTETKPGPQSFILLLSIEGIIEENFSSPDSLLTAVNLCKDNQILSLIIRKFVDDFELNFDHSILKENYLEIWGANLKHAVIENFLKLSSNNTLSLNYETKKLEELRQYLCANVYKTAPTIEKMAYMVDMSPTKFKNYFKRYTGYSPHQYILTIRLNKAFELLSTGNFSISQVAYKIGFNHPASFSRFFKQRFYCSPSEIMLNNMSAVSG